MAISTKLWSSFTRIQRVVCGNGLDKDLVYEMCDLKEYGLMSYDLFVNAIVLMDKYREYKVSSDEIWDLIKFYAVSGIEVYPKGNLKLKKALASMYTKISDFQSDEDRLFENRAILYKSIHESCCSIKLTKDYREDDNYITGADWSISTPCNLYDALHPDINYSGMPEYDKIIYIK